MEEGGGEGDKLQKVSKALVVVTKRNVNEKTTTFLRSDNTPANQATRRVQLAQVKNTEGIGRRDLKKLFGGKLDKVINGTPQPKEKWDGKRNRFFKVGILNPKEASSCLIQKGLPRMELRTISIKTKTKTRRKQTTKEKRETKRDRLLRENKETQRRRGQRLRQRPTTTQKTPTMKTEKAKRRRKKEKKKKKKKTAATEDPTGGNQQCQKSHQKRQGAFGAKRSPSDSTENGSPTDFLKS